MQNKRQAIKKINEARIGLTYFVAATAENAKLRELGLVKGKKIGLLSLTSNNAIVMIAGTRLALDNEMLENIFVTEEQENEVQVSLSTLKPSETGIVRQVEAEAATKRRLMDMGITRGVSIYVRKLAPLGDPMELHLRGYALSLRKTDASMIKVVREDKL